MSTHVYPILPARLAFGKWPWKIRRQPVKYVEIELVSLVDLASGAHDITVQVSQIGSNPFEALVGWHTTRWTILVEEVGMYCVSCLLQNCMVHEQIGSPCCWHHY